MKTVIAIPARFASTRLPGKMLLSVAGKPLIQHVYERARLVKRASEVIVATDDLRIAEAVNAFGGIAVMTDAAHSSGTARIAEAVRGRQADVVINLQGDEPEIDPAAIDRLISLQERLEFFASTLACPFPAAARPDDPSAVKAVLGRSLGEEAYEALYFTRAPAPYPRDEGLAHGRFHLHIGVYAFRADALRKFASAPESRLEKIERLEQLRILEMGEKIAVQLVESSPPGIDTPEDLEAFRVRTEAS